MFGDQLHR